MLTVKVSFKPTKKQLLQIEEWLIDEEKTTNEGFYCNWGVIEDSFVNKKIGVLLFGRSVIGFITWFDFLKVTKIQIAEIKPGFRRMGYGRILAETLFEKLKDQGVMILSLHCQPAGSEKAWKKMGFKNYTDVDGFKSKNSAEGKYLFRILAAYTKPTKAITKTHSIELWPVEPHQTDRFVPLWRWHPKFVKGSLKLALPIIYPAKKDWNIRWSIGNNILKDGKIKYFSRDEIDFSDFIIIDELSYPKGYTSQL